MGKGKGLVARDKIKKGTIVFQLSLSKHHIFSSVENTKAVVGEDKYDRVLHVAVGHEKFPNKIIYNYDDSQYFNHANNPNCGEVVIGSCSEENILLHALRDIDEGEELTESYSSYSYPTWWIHELENAKLMPIAWQLPVQHI